MNYIEWCANFFYVISTVAASQNSAHTWWTGVISCLLFLLTFVHVKLYANGLLQVFFIFTCYCGYRAWRKNPRTQRIRAITNMPTKVFVSLLFLSMLLAGCYGWLLSRFTDAANPFLDSQILFLSVFGQILLILRKVENWVVWFIADAFAAPLYFSKGLHLTAILYFSLTLIAVHGYLRWKKELFLRKENVDVKKPEY